MSNATVVAREAVACALCGFEDVVEWVAIAEEADPVADRAMAVTHWRASHRGGCSARWASGGVDRALMVGPLGPHLDEPCPARDWLLGGWA